MLLEDISMLSANLSSIAPAAMLTTTTTAITSTVISVAYQP